MAGGDLDLWSAGDPDPGPIKKSGLTVCLSDGSLAFVTSPSASSTAATRVPQADRTRAMRARLLEATVELLVERGFAGTSTTLVSDRAGVSRGAQLHHFPTKNDLVVAAVEHLTERRGAELSAAFAELSAEPVVSAAGRRTRLRTTVTMLGDHFASPVFAAALGVDESRPGVREMVQATLDLVRGLGLASTITDDSARRRRILREWADVLDRELDRDDEGTPE